MFKNSYFQSIVLILEKNVRIIYILCCIILNIYNTIKKNNNNNTKTFRNNFSVFDLLKPKLKSILSFISKHLII